MSVKEVMTNLADAARARYSVSDKLTVADITDLIQGENADVAKLIDRSITKIEIPEGVTEIGKDAFRGCSQLTEVTLPSTITSIGENAFADCGALAVVYCNFEKADITGYPWGASSGTLFYFNGTTDLYYHGLTLIAQEAGSTVKLTKIGTPTTSGLQYRTDENDEFVSYTIGAVVTLTNVGDYVQFYNTEETLGNSGGGWVQFVMTGKVAASGNIQSMLNDKKDCAAGCYHAMFKDCTSLTQAPELPATTLAHTCYHSMFEGCTSLTQAPELPATTLAQWCYATMFKDCTSLTQAPKLPATTLIKNCYGSMFWGCTSLTQAPELPATTLVVHCYTNMFRGCSKLADIKVGFTTWDQYATLEWVVGVESSGTFTCPSALPKEFGGSYIPEGWTVVRKDGTSYSGLTLTAEKAGSAVKLRATGSPTTSGLQYRTNENDDFSTYTIDTVIMLKNVGDYVQFYNTEDTLSRSNNYVSFIMTGKIAASGNIQSMLNGREDCVDYCYYNMFRSCTSLTQAPELPATTLADYCYYGMFYGCASLTQAPELPATTLANSCYYGMFYNSALTQAPELPATTLANSCYYRMFCGCRSLTQAPELPATTLANSCYSYMFYGCSKLSYINVGFTEWSGTDSTNRWVYNVASPGTFTCPAELPEEYGVYRIPKGWTVVRKD